MAYRKSKGKLARRMKKIEPAVLTMTLVAPSTPEGVTSRSYIDLSQIASLANRRFYRQGISWAVGGFKVSSLNTGTVTMGKLPSTWTMSNAWEKGFRAWEDMNEFALEDTESVKPRFMDFKIYADSAHHAAGFGANLLPVSYTGVAAVAGEWEPSQVHIPSESPAPGGGSTRDREIIAVGASYPGAGDSGFDAVSLVEGYASSRGLPNVLDPNAPDDAADVDGIAPENWIGALKNEGTEQKKDVLEDMLADNNTAPYPFENGPNPLTPGVGHPDTMYPGGANQLPGLEYHDFVNIFQNSISDGIAIQRMKGGMFPCGLIAIDWTPNVSPANLVIQLDLVPGSHRGYLCEPMTEM